MRKLITVIVLALLVIARGASAQTSLTADRIYLGATGCALRTGAGTPTGGAACDFYFDTATGHVWVNHAGTWIDISTRTPTFQTVTSTTKLTTPLIDTASGPLALAPASGAIVPATNLGASFGTPTQKFLALHLGELWAESLVAQDVLATIGGRVLIAPTTMLTADLAPAATTITVKANTLQNGDAVFLQSAPAGVPQMEWLTVTSSAAGTAGAYTYTVTRNVDGSGANAWVGGDAVVDTGTVGKGFIDLYALSGVLTGAGPTIVGNVRTGSAFNAYAPRFALGNLNALYGPSTDRYGFGAGNPAGAYTFLDDVDGLVMGGPLGTRVQITPAGNATFIGDGGGMTNINGGNIATDSITADKIAAGAVTASELAAGAVTAGKIAAHTITVNELNATGYGDNVIKNGSFEPSAGDTFGAASAFAGWVKSPDATSATALQNAPGGLLGPGTMQVDAGAGTYSGGTYLAVPVERTSGGAVGVKYRISARVFSAGGPVLYLIVSESNQMTPGVRRVIRTAAATAPDVAATSETILGACATLTNGWTTVEYTYTPQPDTTWISLGLYNGSGICAGATYTAMYFDDVEMQKQIGTGHISANSITANLIAAGAITADKITAGTITGDKIAAGTITGTNIAADSITSAHIVAGTIVASDIATGSITADRLNVTALSAITANLGSVTAGSLSAVAITGGTIDGTTIRGVNISASSSITGASISSSTMTAGSVTLDGNGMTVAGGDGGGSARIKLGTVQLWGSNSGGLLVSDGGFDIQAIRAHQNVDFEKLLHVYQNVTVDGTMTAAGNSLTSANFGLTAAGQPTLYWTGGGLPPLANGGTQAYIDTNCNCLARLASSARYKENLRPWTPDDPFALLSVPLYRFDFKPDAVHPTPVKNHVGLMVEDLYAVAPDAVALDRAGRPDGIQDDTLHAYLLAVLRAAEAQILELQKKVAALEAARKKDP